MGSKVQKFKKAYGFNSLIPIAIDAAITVLKLSGLELCFILPG